MSKTKTKPAHLIVAASEQDPDMLYATKFWRRSVYFPSAKRQTHTGFQRSGDRSRTKKAEADEFVMFSDLEREVQGKAKKAPPYEKVLAHFLTKRGVKRALCRLIFRSVTLTRLSGAESAGTDDGLFWPAREKKTGKEIKLLERALRITETGMKRGMEILKGVRPGGKKIEVGWQNVDVGNSARGNRQRDLARRWRPNKHNRSRRRSGVRSARARLRPTESGFTDHSRHFPA